MLFCRFLGALKQTKPSLCFLLAVGCPEAKRLRIAVPKRPAAFGDLMNIFFFFLGGCFLTVLCKGRYFFSTMIEGSAVFAVLLGF